MQTTEHSKPIRRHVFRLREHFTKDQWLGLLDKQRAAEREALRLRVPFTECDQVHGSCALVPLFGA